VKKGADHWLSWMSLAVALLAGCGASEKQERSRRGLPFTVRLQPIRVPELVGQVRKNVPEDLAAERPAVPADFGQNLRLVTRRLAESLDETGLFVRVVTADADGIAADLDMEIEIRGDDFGEGKVMAGGAAFSTTVWLFAGPLAWTIDDRHYPDSNVVLEVAVRRSGEEKSGPARPLFRDRIFLKGLQLDFFERAEASAYLINIIIPPWVGDGTPEVAGTHLARKSLAYFVEQEPDQILTRLPALYFESVYGFLVHDTARQDFVIVSQLRVVEVSVTDEQGRRREVGPDAISLHEVTEEAAKEDLQLEASESLVGIGTENRYYRLPLAANEKGFLRVRATLESGQEAGPWTIWRPE